MCSRPDVQGLNCRQPMVCLVVQCPVEFILQCRSAAVMKVGMLAAGITLISHPMDHRPGHHKGRGPPFVVVAIPSKVVGNGSMTCLRS